MLRKRMSFVVAVIMLVVSVLSPLSAYADDSIESAMENGFTMKNDLLSSVDVTEINNSKKFDYKGKTFYSEGRELYTIMRDRIDRMETSFTINYFSKTKLHPSTIFGISSWKYETLSILRDLIYGATDQRLSVSCTDGDYSRFNMRYYGIKEFNIVNAQEGKYCYSFVFMTEYLYDASLESVLTDKVNEIVNYVNQSGFSDYDAVRYIHDYICKGTVYNVDAVYNPDKNLRSFSAYGALIDGKCVCQGYAEAFYRICKALGFDVRIVYSDPNKGNHAWNLIGLDGRYYYIDLTWDDDAEDNVTNTEHEYGPYSYFLVNYEDLLKYDKSANSHTLDDDVTNDSYFCNSYLSKVSTQSYNRDIAPLLSTARITLSTDEFRYTGSPVCPQLYVYDCYGNMLAENVDYTVSYKDNIKCGLGIATVKGLGIYSGMSSSRSFRITPAKAKRVKMKTADSDSLTIFWDNDGSAGYIVQINKNGKWSDAGIAYTNSYKIKGLSSYKNYKVRVKPFESINRTKYYGDYSSSFNAGTAPKAVTVSSASRSGSTVTARWKKVKCDGYEVQCGTNRSMKKAKSVKVKKASTVSKKIKGLKAGKKQYVRVRAYRTMKDGSGKIKYYYGAWSKIITA